LLSTFSTVSKKEEEVWHLRFIYYVD
jgi:hypothetical protein